jgi:hypothetical protein
MAGSGPPLDYVHMVAIIVECILYGIYVPLFFVTVYLLLLRPRGDRINKSLVFASFFLFVLATMHVAGSLKELFDAFIFFRDGPKGPAGIFAHEAEAANIFRKSVAALSIVVGDSLVIYRCYVIWGRDWRVTVLPIALLIFSIAASVVVLRGISAPDSRVFSPFLLTWVPLTFALSFATNFMVTVLIAYKLYSAGKSVSGSGGYYWRTIAIIAESGAIYPIVNVFVIVLFAMQSTTQAIPVNALAQVVAIAPTIIIIQVQTGNSQASGSAGSWGVRTGTSSSLIHSNSQHSGTTSFKHTISNPRSDPSNPYQTPYPALANPEPVIITVERNVDRQTLQEGTYGAWDEKYKDYSRRNMV